MTIFAQGDASMHELGDDCSLQASPGTLLLVKYFYTASRTALYIVRRTILSGAGRRRSDTPALWRDSSGAEWAGPTGPQDWAVLCRRSAQVTVLCSLAVRRKPRPTWSLRRVEPGQAGNGAAQISRNREFLDRRSEQWLPFCRCAYLDCVAPLCAGADSNRWNAYARSQGCRRSIRTDSNGASPGPVLMTCLAGKDQSISFNQRF